jgi:hypothetical protein
MCKKRIFLILYPTSVRERTVSLLKNGLIALWQPYWLDLGELSTKYKAGAILTLKPCC